MLLAHFGPAQADVYIPAVIALTVAAVVVALPLVFAPRLRGGSGLAARIGAGVVALAAVAGAVVLGIPAQHVLAAQVPALQQQISARYGLHLPDAIVSDLIGGDTIKADDIEPYTHTAETVRLVATPAGYELVSTPSAAAEESQLPVRSGS